jgi:putative salt-induced outer membrane protein YdiY
VRRSLLIGLVGLSVVAQTAYAQEFFQESFLDAAGPQLTPLPPLDAEEQAPNLFTLPNAPRVAPEQAMVPEDLSVQSEPKPVAKLWEGNLEMGVNGTEGNSQTFNLRFGAKLKRKTEWNSLSADLDYRRDSADSQETANRAFLDWRFEHFFKDSPWTWFVHGTVEYDEFQAFDLRVALDTGLGYQFIDTDMTNLIGRFGGGTSREIGGPDDEFLPEAVFGLDFEHKINKRHKLTLTLEYRPDVTDCADYRLNSKAGWEILLDEAMNLSMKITASDRYDSTPHGAKPNDLDYALLMLWGF